MEIKPIGRKLKDVVDHTSNIVRAKANTINKALSTYAAEAKAELVDKDYFNDSDDEEYENPDKLMTQKQR